MSKQAEKSYELDKLKFEIEGHMEECMRFTAYTSIKELLGEQVFIKRFGGQSFDDFNRTVDSWVSEN